MKKIYNIESVIAALEALKQDATIVEKQILIEYNEIQYHVNLCIIEPMHKNFDFKIGSCHYTKDETCKIKPSEYSKVETPKEKLLQYQMSVKPVKNNAYNSWTEEYHLKHDILEACDMRCTGGLLLSGMRIISVQDYRSGFESAEEFLKKKHKKKYENYIAQQNQEKLIDTLIKPGLKEAFDQIGLWYSESDNKLYFRGNVLQEKIEKLLMEEMQPILNQYNISFKSNLKGLSIVRTLGTIKFNKDM